MAACMDATTSPDAEVNSSTRGHSHVFFNHPKVHEMRAYGFGKEDDVKQAFLVYLDLLEAKRWWNVRSVPCVSLQKILISGQPAQREAIEVVLPLRHDNELSVCDLQNLLAKVKTEHECHALTLALMDTDSTIVYYKISDGFMPPAAPEALQDRKRQRQRKLQQRRSRFVHLGRDADAIRAQYLRSEPSSAACMAAGESSSSRTSPKMNDLGELPSQLPPSGLPPCSLPPSGPGRSGLQPVTVSTKRLMGPEAEDCAPEEKHRKLEDQASVQAADTSSSGPGREAERFMDPPGAMGGDGQPPVHPLHHPKAQEAVVMVQAPVVENDSDHDSGMDAGDDDEDEGFDEEL